MKLDSVADALDNGNTSASGGGMGSTTDLLSCQDEKPMMTFGIADYPSLGFKEELAGVGGLTQDGISCNSLYGSLTKCISSLLPEKSDPEEGTNQGSFHSTVWVCGIMCKGLFSVMLRNCWGVWLLCKA